MAQCPLKLIVCTLVVKVSGAPKAPPVIVFDLGLYSLSMASSLLVGTGVIKRGA